METQAYFENIREHIQCYLTDANSQIDLAVAWFTDKFLFDTLCQKAQSGVKVRLLLYDDDINNAYLPFDKLNSVTFNRTHISEY